MPQFPYGLPPEYVPPPPPMEPLVTLAYPLASVATQFAGHDGVYEVYLRPQPQPWDLEPTWIIIDVGESEDIGRNRFGGLHGHPRSGEWRRRQSLYPGAPGIWVRAILTPPDVVGKFARDQWRRQKEESLRLAYAAQGKPLCGLIP